MPPSRPASPAAPAAALHIEGLTLTLGSLAGPVNILKGIDLTIGDGQHVSIVGPSGSGKSSLMMVIGGLERPTGGRVRVAGHTLNDLSEDALARFRRDHVGIVFQSFHLMAAMTALENVALPLELAGQVDAFDRARDGLAAVGLAHRLDHYPGQLSGGEQQRVALARAFAPQPRLILADEPTGNLDQETGEHIIRLIFEQARHHGTTLVLVTHDPGLAARCDRTIRLADGRVVEDAAPRAALAD